MSSNVFIKLPEDIKKLIDGKPEHVCHVKDNHFSREVLIQDESNSFGLEIQRLAMKAREEFDQELEKKLEYLVANCGKDILNHIRIVMDPYAFSVRDDNFGDLDDVNCSITVQARLEYFIDAEVVDG